MTAINGQIIDKYGNNRGTYRCATDGSYLVYINGLSRHISMRPKGFLEYLTHDNEEVKK